MKSIKNTLADYQHPLVSSKAKEITGSAETDREKLEKLFFFVRDKIKFGFPPKGDLVKASETLKMGMGQCNTKGTLFLALCKAVGLPARIHFSLIKKDIQKGLFTGLMYKLMPPAISHSWIEVEIEGKWRKLDSFINDQPFYYAGKQALKQKGWDTGFSVSCAKGESSADFSIEEDKFVQMDAVTEDQGIWYDHRFYFHPISTG